MDGIEWMLVRMNAFELVFAALASTTITHFSFELSDDGYVMYEAKPLRRVLEAALWKTS